MNLEDKINKFIFIYLKCNKKNKIFQLVFKHLIIFLHNKLPF